MISLIKLNRAPLCILTCVALSLLAGCEAEDESESGDQIGADSGVNVDGVADDGDAELDERRSEDEGPPDTEPPAPDEPDGQVDVPPTPPSVAPLDLEADCEARTVAVPIDSSAGTLESGAGYLYAVPEDAHSLLFMFHGGGGSKEENFELRVESILIAHDALERGYAVVSLDSLQHSTPGARDLKWNESEPASNPDVANVSALIELFREEERLVPQDAPVVAMGFSNGGSMASRVAQLPIVGAAVIYISNAQYFNEPGARIPPTVFLPGANDPGHAVRSNTMYMEQIEARGLIGALYINQAEPATQGAFTKIPGVDCSTSKEIIRALIASGWLDDEGYVLRDPKSGTGWLQGLPDAVTTPTVRSQVRDILMELYAGHSPSAQWSRPVFNFVEAHVGD